MWISNPVANRPTVTSDRAINTEDYKNFERKKSAITNASPVGLFQELKLEDHQKINF
jgi:hypothetical protein